MPRAKTYILYGILILAMAGFASGGQPSVAAGSSLELTIRDAVLYALQNNSSFKIELINPELSASREVQAESKFDPSLSTDVTSSGSRDSGEDSARSSIDVGLSKKLESGSSLGITLNTGRTGTGDSLYKTRFALSLTHPLFRNAGDDVNRAGIEQAAIDSQTTIFELQAFTETLVSQVVTAYLDYALAEKSLAIYEESFSLAQKQLDESQVLVDVGKVGEIELVASKAEVALRKEDLINGNSNVEKNRLRLLRLLNPQGGDYWENSVVAKEQLEIPDFVAGELGENIDNARIFRPDLNEAKLRLDRNELDILTTRNGILPDLQLFATLGMSGYAGSFGDSYSSLSTGNNDFQFGVKYSYLFGERNNHERYHQSLLSQDQATEALNNLDQLAVQDVGTAWIEINRTKEQITATEASRLLSEEKLRAETEKYRVGKSTSLLVAQAQRDLLSARINEIQTIANYHKAIIELLRNDGMLLPYFGIYLDDPGTWSGPVPIGN